VSLNEIKYLADENIDREVVKFLLKKGIDVVHVPEIGRSGNSDLDLMRLAHEQDRAILTHDSDFGTLAFVDNEPFFAIVYLRPGHFDPVFTIESLTQLFALDLELQASTIITASRKGKKLTVRIRLV